MKIDITSMFFNSKIEGQTATPAWGTSIGQNKSRACRIDDFKSEVVDMVIGMTYKSVADIDKLDVSKGSGNRDIITCSVFEDVYINNKKIDNTQYVLLLVREHSKSHDGRLLISYAPYIKYNGIENQSCIELMQQLLGCSAEGCWFVYDISIKNQSELYFRAVVVNPSSPMVYSNSTKSKNRSEEWKALIPSEGEIESGTKVPLQQIFYGAPGTGKSNTIKRETEEAENAGRVFRTTFHPDSDYSTFVGCYKPSMKSSERIYSLEELTAKLKEIKTSGTTYPCHKFGAKYWKSLKDLSAENIKRILTACGFTETMNVEVSKGIAIGQEYLNNSEGGKIIYSFTPQAFTNAYVKAWNTEEDVYLIIEEINRGNCAQIFGDLFQLLDRKDGKSEYPIDADTDLRNYLTTELANSTRNDFPEGVKEGKKLVLPPNLYIWATMNTSDQSLFPIDSAFKRRWDWVYIPISASDEDNFGIKVGKHFYDWGKFISQINRVVANVTSSEDKQLGFYFCKADEDGNVISANRFVNKVLFYLWNDVFKNYGFDATLDGKAVFKYKNDEDKDDTMSFTSFYISNGMPNVKQIKRLMDNLGLEGVDEWPAERAEEDSSDGTVKLLSVTYEGNAVEGASHKEVFLKTLELIVKDRDADEVARVIGSEMTKNPPSPSETTRNYVKVGDSDWYVATRNGKDRFLRHLKNLAGNLELNLVAQ